MRKPTTPQPDLGTFTVTYTVGNAIDEGCLECSQGFCGYHGSHEENITYKTPDTVARSEEEACPDCGGFPSSTGQCGWCGAWIDTDGNLH